MCIRDSNNTMDDKNTYSDDKYLEIIAEKEGITKEEVQQEVGRAVSIALNSPDPKMQRFWTDFPCENGNLQNRQWSFYYIGFSFVFILL